MGDGEIYHGRNGLIRYSHKDHNKFSSIYNCVTILTIRFCTSIFQVGLKGESLSLHSLSGSSSVEWAEGAFVAQKQPLTWYKVSFSIFKNQNAVYLDKTIFSMFNMSPWLASDDFLCSSWRFTVGCRHGKHGKRSNMDKWAELGTSLACI